MEQNQAVVESKDEEEEIKSIDEFQEKIKPHLNESDEEHQNRFNELRRVLTKFKPLDELDKNPGINSLINEFYLLIRDEKSAEQKEELFIDLVTEMKSHLLKNSPIPLTNNQIKQRKKRIKKIKQEIHKLKAKLDRLENREVSLDDLDAEDNAFLRYDKYQKLLVKRYQQLRDAEVKPVYFGEDDLDFNSISDCEELNKLLKKEIMSKYKKKNELPDYNEVLELVSKFSKDNFDQRNLDPKIIFKRIMQMFKDHNRRKFDHRLKSYLLKNEANQLEPIVETEELKNKLDAQNKFRDQLVELMESFIKKANNEPNDESIEDEESEDSESDSNEDDSIETVSDDEEEFISKGIDDGNDDDDNDDDNNAESIEKHESKDELITNSSTNEEKFDEIKLENETANGKLKRELNDVDQNDVQKKQKIDLNQVQNESCNSDDCILLE